MEFFSKVNTDISELTALATRGLVPMFDPTTELFCARLVCSGSGLIRQGQSPRYTIMTLLGLRERELSGAQIPFDSQRIYAAFVRDSSWVESIGDLGLLIWLAAEFNPDQLEVIFGTFELNSVLGRFKDGCQGSTTELAWFLAGLSHAAMTSPSVAARLKDLAVDAYRLTMSNQGISGFFGHLAIRKSVRGLVRGRIGNFADQIYPIYSFSKFAIAFHTEEPLEPAVRCARAICEAQGDQGQWWWLYDSVKGQVSSRYPVYSVHQHAMAPMGLFAIEKATGQDFQEHIYRGLRWIYGDNELGVDMRDQKEGLVWRCIRPKNKITKYWDTVTSLLRRRKKDAPVGALEVLYEDWPYELGWLLYAFSRNKLRVSAEPKLAPASQFE
jgi:hypothetical protein